MTIREITFFFNKAPGTLNPHFLDARPALMRADQDALSKAVSTIFGTLIQNNEAKYRTRLHNLSAFCVTLLNPFSGNPSLKIESAEINVQFTNVKAETAALFLNSISISPNTQISAEEKARLKAEKLHRELLEDNPDEASTAVAAVPKQSPIAQPVSEEEEMFTAVFMNMNQRFANTLIKRTDQTQQNFGDYIMSRLFIQATSYSYHAQTNEFKMNFESERTFNLTNLPENISAESRENLKQLQNSVLKLSKEIKGKFNEDSISFEPGSMIIEWPKSWTSFVTAQLLRLYETQNETITMQIKYGKLPVMHASAFAQDFVDFVESNLPK